MEIERKTVIIKPVPRVKFSGQAYFSGTTTSFEGAQLGKSGYKTGLTKEEEIKFCEELGLPKGTLSKHNAEFWGSFLSINLPNDKPYYMEVTSLLDTLKYKCLVENNKIAKSELDLKKNPLADFYIEDSEAKAKVEEIIINVKMEAMDALRNLTIDEKKGFLKIYGRRGLNEVSDSFVNTSLFKEVDKDPDKFLRFVSNPDIKLRISIEEMLESGVLTKKGQYFYFENELIGNSIDSVISFFKDYKNQSIKIAAQSATQETKRGKKKKTNEE